MPPKSAFSIDGVIRNLWARTKINPVTGCWEWQGYLDPHGYGRIFFRGKNWYIHRLAAYISLNFQPGGRLRALHKCDNACCWRWSHIYV